MVLHTYTKSGLHGYLHVSFIKCWEQEEIPSTPDRFCQPVRWCFPPSLDIWLLSASWLWVFTSFDRTSPPNWPQVMGFLGTVDVGNCRGGEDIILKHCEQSVRCIQIQIWCMFLGDCGTILPFVVHFLAWWYFMRGLFPRFLKGDFSDLFPNG